MRWAALYDIHANLPALEAVLRELARESLDGIVIGGDVLPGPMPVETLACLRGLDVPLPCIRGNGDRAVLETMAGKASEALPASARAVVEWVAGKLTAADRDWIASWPATLTLTMPGLGRVLFCHATPRNDTEVFTRETAGEHLEPIFAAVDAEVVVCGHTHMQFERRVAGKTIVNAGSVGMPFGHTGADWLRLGPTLELRHTAYDLAAAAAGVRAGRYPQAEEFAARELLSPRSEAEMLEIFSRAELR